MNTIAIVEDEVVIRNELALFLHNSDYMVNCITDFNNASKEILLMKPDIVLLDINLPGISGNTICANIRKESDIPIIFVTSMNTSMDELNCLLNGGDDYVTKPYQLPVLLARINAVLKRTTKTEAVNKYSYKRVVFDIAAGTLMNSRGTVELTKNELKICICLFSNQGQIVSREKLIDYLWDNDVYIDDNALSIHVTRLRTKLKEIGEDDFIETKRGLGYKI